LDLYYSIDKKLDEAYRSVADLPAEIVWIPDNVTEDLISPKMFEKYCLPFYKI